MGVSVNSFAVLNIIQTNTNSAPSNSGPIISGFAKNLPLKTVLMIVVPPYWSISATDEILKKTVSWSGGSDWVTSLNTIADEYNLLVTRNANTKSIKIIEIKTSPSFISIPESTTQPNKPITKPTTIPTKEVLQKTIAMLPNPPAIHSVPVIINANEPTQKSITIEPCVSGCDKSIATKTPNQFVKLQTLFSDLLTDFDLYPKDTAVTKTAPSVPVIINANVPTQKSNMIEPCVSGCGKPIIIQKYNQLSKLQTIFGRLLTDFNFIYEDLIVTKTTQESSNTVRFDFAFNGMKKDASVKYMNFSSFFVFTKSSVYAPMFKPFEFPVILDWYSSNFTHPALVTKPVMIKDLVLLDLTNKEPSTVIKDVVSKKLKISKKTPSFLQNKYYTAKDGEMLSSVLKSWSKLNNVSLIWNATNDFKVFKEIKLFGNLLSSTDTIIRFYNNTSNPLQTRFFTKNKTFLIEDLSIIHRSK